MGCGGAIRRLDRIAWPGESGLNNAKPGLKGRHPGSDNPSEAKTPGEALSYIEMLYKSGRMEDLAKLLRSSQVFRAAWLILQQSSPEVSGAGGGGQRSLAPGESQGPAHLPVPAGGPPALTIDSKPRLSGYEVAKAESFSQIPAGMAKNGENDSLAPRSQAAQPLSSLLQAYQNQDAYWGREKQRGQLVSVRA
jgi:hypothetical protein